MITATPYALRAATGGDESGVFGADKIYSSNGVTTGNRKYFYEPFSKWLIPAPFQVIEGPAGSDGIQMENFMGSGLPVTLYKALGGGDYHTGFGFLMGDQISSAIAYIGYGNNNSFQVRRTPDFLSEPVGPGSYALLTVRDRGVGIKTEKPQAEFDVEGTTRTKILQITGGADLAEHLTVIDANALDEFHVQSGMVVSIDSTGSRKFKLSDEPYDRKRVGIISGGNGVKPGLVLRDEGNPQADGEHPIALTGQVWCHADATQVSIEPGDLLTTSSTPGHAMKVSAFEKARFAVLGQALTGLKEGRGRVQVLVGKQ